MVEVDERLGELNPPQLVAFQALLEGKSKIKAAALAGITRQTIYKWLAAPGMFRTLYLEVITDIYYHSIEAKKLGYTSGIEGLLSVASQEYDPSWHPLKERNYIEACKSLATLPALPPDLAPPDEGPGEEVHIYFPAKGSLRIEAGEQAREELPAGAEEV